MPRKSKRARRSKQVRNERRSCYPSFQRLYSDACTRAKAEWPDLLGIHECKPHLYRQSTNALVRHFGYENWTQRFWECDSDDYAVHAESKGNMAGHVAILSDGQQDRPVVFLMRPTGIWNRDYASALMMAILFHELGHVDDITRSLHIVFDASVDITAAEEHAHGFACKRIMSQTEHLDAYMTELAHDLGPEHRREWHDCVTQYYRVIMAFYIGEVLPLYAQLPHESVREAAQRVLGSEDMASYREFAGDAMDGLQGGAVGVKG